MGFSQESLNNRVQKKLAVADSILLDSVSINPYKFKVLNKQLQPVDSTLYKIDFAKSILTINNQIATDSGLTLNAQNSGLVTSVTANKIVIKDQTGKKLTYFPMRTVTVSQ